VRLTLSGAEETRRFGARLGAALEGHAGSETLLVHLRGDLGAGKTTLVAGVLAALGHQGVVRSPTYALVEPYRLAGRDVIHCDLYRLRHPDELEDLGLADMRTPRSVLLVEWPDRAEGRLGTPDLELLLEYAGDKARLVTVAPATAAGSLIAAGLG
jgi:tRNA threonylcarbamoyladenosine biosynthesis protein TsaE